MRQYNDSGAAVYFTSIVSAVHLIEPFVVFLLVSLYSPHTIECN